MSFRKNGIMEFNIFDEISPYAFMKTKVLSDGSSWGRINWLDISSDTTLFNASEAMYCIDKTNRFSLMGRVDYFRGSGGLPEGYTRIDYIESTGAEHIDTGYYWKHENVKIFIDAIVTNNSSSQSLFGNEEPRSGGRYFGIIPHGSNGTYSFYAGETGSVNSASITLKKRFKMECSTTIGKTLTVSIDGVKKFTSSYPGTIMTYANTTSTSANKGRIYIFTNNNSSNSAYISQRISGMRLYAFQMWDNDVMVRNFIPCLNEDGVIGLWDTITKAFFTTPAGNFIAGGALNSTSIEYGGNYEFMLTYPKKSDTMYNRWIQTISPNSDWVASDAGQILIQTDFTAYKAPLTRTNGSAGSAPYTCSNIDNWWAPIGQYSVHQGGIPAADGSIQKETELWVRLDNLHPDTMKLITSPSFYIEGEDSDIARIVANAELHSAQIIEH